MQSHIKIIDYFEHYPLLSSKYLAYKDWKYVVKQGLRLQAREGKPLTAENVLVAPPNKKNKSSI